MTASPHHSSVERRAVMSGELFMQKLDEVNKSVKVCTISFLLIALIKELKAYLVLRILSWRRNELLLLLRLISFTISSIWSYCTTYAPYLQCFDDTFFFSLMNPHINALLSVHPENWVTDWESSESSWDLRCHDADEGLESVETSYNQTFRLIFFQ